MFDFIALLVELLTNGAAAEQPIVVILD